jgi:hypothetical protein
MPWTTFFGDLPALTDVDVSDDEDDGDDCVPIRPLGVDMLADDLKDPPELADDSDRADSELCDIDLEHLTSEERMKLAVTAVQKKIMSARKAAIYYRVPHSTPI